MRLMVALTALALTTGQVAAAGKLYRCDAKSIAGLVNADGTLDDGSADNDSRGWRNFHLTNYAGMLVDAQTGLLRFKRGGTLQWGVVQQGGNSDDWVLANDKSMAQAVTDNIRILAWAKEPQVTFFLVSLGMAISGTCKEVR